MIWYHGFSVEEMAEATGLPGTEIREVIERAGLAPEGRPALPEGAPLLVLPYPGGRHPRIGFRDGAIDPRADTKLSVVSPWEPGGYAVVDLPEAIWWGDRLLFLAHTHIPTIWTEAGVELGPSPWENREGGTLSNRRTLPNGVVIAAEARPTPEAVFLELSLENGSNQPLDGLRAQVCVLLRGMAGFDQQSSENKVNRAPYSACQSPDGRRWIVTAWEPCHRAWDNPPCPCLHSDPSFPDCPPGESVRARGVLAFVTAKDADEAIRTVEALGWRADRQEPSRTGR
ncbi:hypothetical protein TsocGM_17280 [Tautonia sociabilis]|uniref:Uncharacterized protein n=2 Tax=Tautonia sociabilis TaxID=2080755 RepID=A0A432MGN4_9BACT|nr:hypothetical protein TsocGM_17280 [Tautonia sociabilis]